ncbi:MAG: hypothetical protein RIG82_02920 [Phycisphaeraceae bacterium]
MTVTTRLIIRLTCLSLLIISTTLAQPRGVPLQANPDTVALAPRDILTRLDDDDWSVRDTATRELLTNPRIDPQRLHELMTQATTPEQKHRLIEVAHHHFVQRLIRENFAWEGEGSIGIIQREAPSIEIDGQPRAGISVIRTLPGLPGHERLREGDLVVQLAGEWFEEGSTMEDFQAHTRSQPPGSILSLTVLRDGQTLSLTIETAPLEALRATYEGPNFGLTEGPLLLWHAERQRLTGDTIPLNQAADPAITLEPLNSSSL